MQMNADYLHGALLFTETATLLLHRFLPVTVNWGRTKVRLRWRAPLSGLINRSSDGGGDSLFHQISVRRKRILMLPRLLPGDEYENPFFLYLIQIKQTCIINLGFHLHRLISEECKWVKYLPAFLSCPLIIPGNAQLHFVFPSAPPHSPPNGDLLPLLAR